MEDHFEILSRLVKRKRPQLPEQFFESFSSNLFVQPDQPEEPAETVFEKRPKPAVPAAFFQDFHDNLKAEIDAEKALNDLGLVKRKKPSLPENFENDFNVELMMRIRLRPVRGRILKISFWSAAAAVAATITLLLTWNTEKTSSENPVAEIQPAAMPDDESLDTYVAYLDEESLVDYIIENDINIGESEATDEVYDYVDGEIEEVYIEL